MSRTARHHADDTAPRPRWSGTPALLVANPTRTCARAAAVFASRRSLHRFRVAGCSQFGRGAQAGMRPVLRHYAVSRPAMGPSFERWGLGDLLLPTIRICGCTIKMCWHMAAARSGIGCAKPRMQNVPLCEGWGRVRGNCLRKAAIRLRRFAAFEHWSHAWGHTIAAVGLAVSPRYRAPFGVYAAHTAIYE